jgi:DNA polymerase
LFRRKDRTTIALDLPSGRSLYYNNVRYAERGREVVHGPGKGQKIYGGILAENCTQAVARDVLAEAILAAEQAGYPVLLSIHDELICRIPEGQGEECLQFLIETLSRTPEWADRDLILAAEGHIATDLSK